MSMPSHTFSFFEQIVGASISHQFTEENSPFALDCKCGRAALYSARQGIMVPPLPKFKRRTDVKNNAINYVLSALQSGGVQIGGVNCPDHIVHGQIHIGRHWQVLGIPDNPRISYLFQLILAEDYEMKDYQRGQVGYFDQNNAQVIMRLSGLTKTLFCYYSAKSGEIAFCTIDLNIIYADEILNCATQAIENGNMPPQLEGEPAQCAECPFQTLCYTPTTSYPTCRNCAYFVMNPEGVIGCSKMQQTLNRWETYKGCDEHLYRPDFLNNFADFKDAGHETATYDNMLNGEPFTNGKGQNDFTSKEIHFAPDKGMLGDSNIRKIKSMFDARIIK